MKVIDIHVHINPWQMYAPGALETFFRGKTDREKIKNYMDENEVERAGRVLRDNAAGMLDEATGA